MGTILVDSYLAYNEVIEPKSCILTFAHEFGVHAR